AYATSFIFIPTPLGAGMALQNLGRDYGQRWNNLIPAVARRRDQVDSEPALMAVGGQRRSRRIDPKVTEVRLMEKGRAARTGQPPALPASLPARRQIEG